MMKKNIGILVMLLSLIAFVGCEKAPIDPESKLIEVKLATKPFSIDVEGGLKSTQALPGWPDIAHAHYSDFGGTLYFYNDAGTQFVVNVPYGGLDTTTILLDQGLYAAGRSVLNLQNAPFWNGPFYNVLSHYYSSSGYYIPTAPTPSPYDTIDSFNNTLSIELMPARHCYAFKDPDKLISVVARASNMSGIPRADMAFIPPSLTIADTVFYCYSDQEALWVHLVDGTRVTVDLAAHIATLGGDGIVMEQTHQGVSVKTRPFTCYVDLTAYTPTVPNVIAGISVLSVWPYTEVIIDPS
jgi:hypothetical protein